MVQNKKLFGQLFTSFLRLGFFTFGGGYAMIPLIERELVQRKKWLTAEELVNNLAIVQALPGAVAINLALAIGQQFAGRFGLLVAGLGVILPSFIVIISIAGVYNLLQSLPVVTTFFVGVRPVVVGLIAAAAIKMGGQILKSWQGWGICLSVFGLVAFVGLNPVYPIVVTAVFGVLWKRWSKTTDEADHGSLEEE